MGTIENENDLVVISHETVKNNDKLYICAVSEDGKKQFVMIDISNTKQLVIDTQMPLRIFNEGI